MRPLYHRALLVGLIALPACSSPPPPVAPPPPASASAPVVPMAAHEPDLSPVVIPKGTVALGRWLNVEASLKNLEKLKKLPFSLLEILEKELDDKEIVALLKLDAPVDAAVMIDPSSPPDNPKPLGVISLPLRDFKETLAVASRFGKPLSLRPGVYRLGRNRDIFCDLSVAVGPASARLLCSQNERDLDLLVPWMTRGLPEDSFGTADLHLELRAEGFRERYKAELEQLGPLLPNMLNDQLMSAGIKHQGLIDLLTGVVADGPKLANDLDVLALDLRLDGEKSEVSVAGSVRFKSTSSWMARLATHRNDKAGPPPAIFWQVPKDSDSASFNRGSDPKFFEGIREVLASGARELLGGKLDGGDVKAISELLERIPLTNPEAIVVARGHLPPEPAPKEIKKENFKPTDAIRLSREQARALMGWSLIGVEAKADVYADWLRNLVKVYNSRTLQNTLKKQLQDKAGKLPTLKIVAAPKGAPKGTVTAEVSFPIFSRDVWFNHGRLHDYRDHPKGPDAKGSLRFLITVSPDGNRTWIGLGADPKILGEHLAYVQSNAPKETTLASRSDLELLKSGSYTNGGFFSLGGLAKNISGSLQSMLDHRDREEMERFLGAMPNKGETPILLLVTGTTSTTPTNTVEIRLQKGTLDDLATLGLLLFSPRKERKSAPMDAPSPH
ncbi:MAG: hypothetical protein RMJ98_14480 [Myxococcales bacterium]|nr:hypothetical protein [Polyangiaceae bacterium]MDW8250498.1 hypothetical protein [Myxococcales bacterium]